MLGPVVRLQIMHESMEQRWSDTDRGEQVDAGKTVPLCHFVHHIQCRLTWSRIRASPVRSRRLADRAIARPIMACYKWICDVAVGRSEGSL
jgi:hypothetical protein